MLELTVAVLVALFLVQKHGTAGIGALFGPVMVLWFLVLAVSAIAPVAQHPAILGALNPFEGLAFLWRHGWVAFVALGAVVLAVTGAEALYADMGHFGARPIRLSWFILVLPALALNYLGQGALLAAHPEALENPFFKLFPDWALLPMVALSTAATVIASQAVISGAYSMTNQAVQLGFLPRMRIEHTSEREIGQIFVPAVNMALLRRGDRRGARLSLLDGARLRVRHRRDRHDADHDAAHLLRGAPCVAPSPRPGACGDDLLRRHRPHLLLGQSAEDRRGRLVPAGHRRHRLHGMSTWAAGRVLLNDHLRADAIELAPFLESVMTQVPMRAPGTAVFMNAIADLTPTALLHNLKHNHVLHASNLFVTVETQTVPWVRSAERAVVEAIAPGCFTIHLRFGFKDRIDVPAALALLGQGIDVDPMTTSYFLSRATVVPTFGKGMAAWREKLFASMHRNATAASDFLNLPANRVVELGTKVQI